MNILCSPFCTTGDHQDFYWDDSNNSFKDFTWCSLGNFSKNVFKDFFNNSFSYSSRYFSRNNFLDFVKSFFSNYSRDFTRNSSIIFLGIISRNHSWIKNRNSFRNLFTDYPEISHGTSPGVSPGFPRTISSNPLSYFSKKFSWIVKDFPASLPEIPSGNSTEISFKIHSGTFSSIPLESRNT